MPAEQTWDEVLHAVEADVARTESAMRMTHQSFDRSTAVPALLQLPSAGPWMPPPEDMDDVPEELCERIVVLQRRIDDLQEQLRVEMLVVRTSLMAPSRMLATAPIAANAVVPRLFDSRI